MSRVPVRASARDASPNPISSLPRRPRPRTGWLPIICQPHPILPSSLNTPTSPHPLLLARPPKCSPRILASLLSIQTSTPPSLGHLKTQLTSPDTLAPIRPTPTPLTPPPRSLTGTTRPTHTSNPPTPSCAVAAEEQGTRLGARRETMQDRRGGPRTRRVRSKRMGRDMGMRRDMGVRRRKRMRMISRWGGEG